MDDCADVNRMVLAAKRIIGLRLSPQRVLHNAVKVQRLFEDAGAQFRVHRCISLVSLHACAAGRLRSAP